jgi:hypothetical protein
LRRDRPGSPNTRFASRGKVDQVLVDERIALTAESGEPVLDVGRVARLAHLAVVDDVHAGFRLLRDDLFDGEAHTRVERGGLDGHALLLREHRPDEVVGPRQTPGVRGQKTIGASVHRISPGCRQAGRSSRAPGV